MFKNKLYDFYESFGSHKNMVLSTIYENTIHSRMMSIILLDNNFYFQTDKNFEKCCDIEYNNYVSICIDNYSVEGICKLAGRPKDNKKFCDAFKTYYPKSFELYTFLKNEVLYEIKPVFIKRWVYDNNQPYIEVFDMIKREYSIQKYSLD